MRTNYIFCLGEYLTKYFFLSSAYSFQCYECAEGSKSECDRNQTLNMCKVASFHCATAMFTRSANDHTYMKKCLPLPYINNYCNAINGTLGPIYNCSISSCDRDYCNGPKPTTPTIPTVMNTSPTNNTTDQESTTASKRPNVNSGSRSTSFGSSTFGVIILALALDKIMNIWTVSWDVILGKYISVRPAVLAVMFISFA